MTANSTSTTLGIDLNPASYANPVVIEAGVTVSTSQITVAAVAIYSGAAGFFLIRNYGYIKDKIHNLLSKDYGNPHGYESLLHLKYPRSTVRDDNIAHQTKTLLQSLPLA